MTSRFLLADGRGHAHRACGRAERCAASGSTSLLARPIRPASDFFDSQTRCELLGRDVPQPEPAATGVFH